MLYTNEKEKEKEKKKREKNKISSSYLSIRENFKYTFSYLTSARQEFLLKALQVTVFVAVGQPAYGNCSTKRKVKTMGGKRDEEGDRKIERRP